MPPFLSISDEFPDDPRQISGFGRGVGTHAMDSYKSRNENFYCFYFLPNSSVIIRVLLGPVFEFPVFHFCHPRLLFHPKFHIFAKTRVLFRPRFSTFVNLGFLILP